MKKITLVLAAAGVLSCGSFAFAGTTSTDAALQQEIKTLQAQLAALEAKVNANAAASTTATTQSTAPAKPAAQPTIATSTAGPGTPEKPFSVSVANYTGVEPRYDGFNLIVNNPGINNDVALLKLRKAEINYYEKSNQPYEGTPKLIFSGEIEGTSEYTTAYPNTPAGTNFNLTDAELDTFVEANRWVSGFMTFGYNSGNDDEANRVNNSELQLGQGYLTVGDLSTLPVYASLGQMYVPFGRYSSYMISTPSSKTLGRVQTRAINLGYTSSNTEVSPFAAVYGFQGATELDGNPASGDDVEGYGANTGLSFSKGEYSGMLGVSYISNIAESSGLQGDGSDGSGFAQSSASEDLAKRVPGADIYGQIGYGNYVLLAEYVEATRQFDAADLSYNGQGAKPQAVDIEAAYSFELWHPSYVALAYGESWQALTLGLPQKNYGVVYSTAIWQNTALSFEVMHNIGYSTTDTAQLDGTDVTQNSQGQSYNTVSLRFDLFF